MNDAATVEVGNALPFRDRAPASARIVDPYPMVPTKNRRVSVDVGFGKIFLAFFLAQFLALVVYGLLSALISGHL